MASWVPLPLKGLVAGMRGRSASSRDHSRGSRAPCTSSSPRSERSRICGHHTSVTKISILTNSAQQAGHSSASPGQARHSLKAHPSSPATPPQHTCLQKAHSIDRYSLPALSRDVAATQVAPQQRAKQELSQLRQAGGAWVGLPQVLLLVLRQGQQGVGQALQHRLVKGAGLHLACRWQRVGGMTV